MALTIIASLPNFFRIDIFCELQESIAIALKYKVDIKLIMQNIINPRNWHIYQKLLVCLVCDCRTAVDCRTAGLQDYVQTMFPATGTLQRCTTLTPLQTLWPTYEWRKCAQFVLKRFNQSTYRYIIFDCLIDIIQIVRYVRSTAFRAHLCLDLINEVEPKTKEPH